MRSKNSKSHSKAESAHLQAVKGLACVICNAPPPSDAHHIKQGNHFTCVALCKDCHQGSFNGIHGQKRMWNVMKMDENDALNETIRRIVDGLQ